MDGKETTAERSDSGDRRQAIEGAHRILTLSVFALLIGGAIVAPSRSAAPSASEVVVLDERNGSGERCLVCGVAVYDHAVVEARYRGRTFHVAADMLDEFKSDPGRYFYALEARSGLFDEAAVVESGRGVSYAWFGFGLYVLVGLLFGAVCGVIAVGRASSPLRWFFGGLVLNAIALALLLKRPREETALAAGVPDGMRKVPTTRAPVVCPSCGAQVHPAGRRCSRCSSPLVPLVTAETMKI